MESATSPYFTSEQDLGGDVLRFSRADVVDSGYIERHGSDLQRWAAAQTRPKVVLDMEPVRQLSSGALGMLVGLSNAVTQRDGSMCIACLDSKLREVFKLTKLTKLFTICDDLNSAKRYVE